jgi:hypothetical protein
MDFGTIGARGRATLKTRQDLPDVRVGQTLFFDIVKKGFDFPCCLARFAKAAGRA